MMTDQYVIIRYDDGREGAVLPADFGNPEHAENFRGAKIIRNEDGSDYDGPTTAEGMARKAEREAEERSEARAKARAERASAREEPAAERVVRHGQLVDRDTAEPIAREADKKE